MKIHVVSIGLGICMLICIEIGFAQPTKKKSQVQAALPESSRIINYEITENGDTINRMDSKQQKQGKWLNIVEARYGEDGYMEYGTYQHNVKVGTWQSYELNGQLLSEEFFKSGNKDGEARYFDNGKLFCVGNYLALRSKYLYDTIMVEDPITNMEKPIRIKTEIGSVRHGTWTYYDVNTQKITREVEYQADEIVYEKDLSTNAIDSNYIQQKKKVLPHVSNKPTVNAWQLDNSKKAARFTDFPEKTQYVKPNVRKK